MSGTGDHSPSDAAAPAPDEGGGRGGPAEQAQLVLGDLDSRGGGRSGAWELSIGADDAQGPRVAESLLTVADGLVGTRGSLEEDGPTSVPGCFLAGIYQEAPDTTQALMTLPSWVALFPSPHLGTGDRHLDLRSGVLWRTVVSAEGTVFRSARWACLARPGTEVLVAEAAPGVLRPEVQGPEVVHFEGSSATGARVTGVIETKVERSTPEASEPARVALTRVASFSVATGPSGGPDVAGTAHLAARRAGARRLLVEQRAAWRRRWSNADVEVVGDPELTLAARFALFQLAGFTCDHGEAAVGARGLSGSAYAGHVFWDADVFVLPVLAATHPPAARAMLEYRLRRLPAARRAAQAGGRAGARFPWESAAGGEDVTPRLGINQHGEAVPILTGELEEHITADVAWAAWHLASVTGDWSFLEGPGRALVTETASYWASRIRLDAQGRGHIDSVIGPDEYHEKVDDNAFTNSMAAWNLRRGAELIERRGSSDDAPRRVDEDAEVDRWRELADSLVNGYEETTGRHQQFAGYDDLEPLLAADLGPVPLAADLVLGRQRLAASQIIKQADVLMLHHLVPEAMEPGSLRQDLDYYLPRTAHGSTLSPAVHASLLARVGRVDQAANLLDLARRVDLDDLTGTTSGGLHVAALGGLWQALVFGFAGLKVQRPDDLALVVDPRLPDHWDELRLRLLWHGIPVRVRCRNDRVHVAAPAALPVIVGAGAPVMVEPTGAWLEVDGQREEVA